MINSGGWSKYGGGRAVLTIITGEWACQSCGSTEPKGLPDYIYEFTGGEFIRVCAICVHERCMSLRKRQTDPLQTYLEKNYG